jgi:hypothetical protein
MTEIRQELVIRHRDRFHKLVTTVLSLRDGSLYLLLNQGAHHAGIKVSYHASGTIKSA